MVAADRHETSVGGHALRFTSLGRAVYPEAGMTKADVLAYYARVGAAMVPHLAGHATEVRVYPDGVAGEGFWQRDLPADRPAWMQVARVHAATRGGDIEYPDILDVASLLWCANRNMLEFHVFLAPWRTPLRPARLVLDLDPGPGRDVVDCADIALVLRDTLARSGLAAFPKTSGGKGLQLYVPLNTGEDDYARTKAYARGLAEAYARLAPELVTARVAKEARRGKVLLDWGQNERNHLMVAPYSLRARPRPSVSTPLRWDEVERLAARREADLVRFTPEEVLARVEKEGDLFAPVLTMRQRLPT